MFIDQRLLTAACQVARQPFLLHCSPFIQLGGWGRYYFQVTIDALDDAGGNIAVGIDVQKPPDVLREALVPGFVGNEAGVFGCAMQVKCASTLQRVTLSDSCQWRVAM